MPHHVKHEPQGWTAFGLRMAVSTVMYPCEYAKTLMQLGYEPLHAYPGTLPWGKPIMVLPNVFQYIKYIHHTDGLAGCYRGLTPKLMGTVVSMLICEPMVDSLGVVLKKRKRPYDMGSTRLLGITLLRDTMISAIGVIVTQPFHVISVRMMAEFVGRERLYPNMTAAFREIYKQNGVLGFYTGFVPRLCYDVGCVLIGGTVAYILNHFLVRKQKAQGYNSGFVQFVVSVVLYPLQVISACMCVSGTRLMAGAPPIMPIYSNWTHCAKDLYKHGELLRGGQLFWRTLPNIQRRLDYKPLSAPLLQ